MKKLVFYFIGLSLIFLSCCKDDDLAGTKTNDKGEIISLPYLWKIPIHEDGNWKNHNPSLENNMVFGQNVIIPTTTSSKSRNLTMISSVDGSLTQLGPSGEKKANF